MAQEPATFTTQFNSDGQHQYDQYDPDHDIAADEAEGGGFGKLAFFLALFVVLFVGVYAANKYLTPPPIVVRASIPPVMMLTEPQGRTFSGPHGERFPEDFAMTCIKIDGQQLTITPNPIPVCMTWM